MQEFAVMRRGVPVQLLSVQTEERFATRGKLNFLEMRRNSWKKLYNLHAHMPTPPTRATQYYHQSNQI